MKVQLTVNIRDYLNEDKTSWITATVHVEINGSVKTVEAVVELLKSIPDSEIQ